MSETILDTFERAKKRLLNFDHVRTNPALAAGLKAVYIPHQHTWRLEHEEIEYADDGRVLTLAAFAELRNHF